jgi:hypothetical protein
MTPGDARGPVPLMDADPLFSLVPSPCWPWI